MKKFIPLVFLFLIFCSLPVKAQFADDCLTKSINLLEAGKYKEAIPILNMGAKKSPQEPAAKVCRAMADALKMLKKTEAEASAELRMMVERSDAGNKFSPCIKKITKVINMYGEAGQTADSRRKLANYLYARAFIYYHMADYYETHRGEIPQNEYRKYYAKLGGTEVRKVPVSEYDVAVKDCTEAISLSPKFRQAYYLRALACIKIDRVCAADTYIRARKDYAGYISLGGKISLEKDR